MVAAAMLMGPDAAAMPLRNFYLVAPAAGWMLGRGRPPRIPTL
jgi:hypothetical protein